jgi:hypothetical protein
MPGQRRSPTYSRKSESRETRRSLNAPLWAIGIALVGYPLLRDATADRMQRTTYRNLASCECAYSRDKCSTNSSGQWVGPWFATDADDRKPDDPGSGKYCPSGRSGGYHGGYAWGGNSSGSSTGSSSGSSAGASSFSGGDVGPPIGAERGHRGGFGGSGRVRAGG